ncbi:MAG: aminotransferase class IV [Micrococcales bacterium]
MNQLLRLSSSGLAEVKPSLDTQLAVADSLLVENGRARSLEAHFERFKRGVEKVSPSELHLLPSLFEFFRQLVSIEGRQFPRLELHANQPAGQRLHLHLRSAPDALGPATLWTFPDADPRIDPSIKGPDLALGAELRNKAQILGADEAVIIDSDGYLIEGALSAIVWWRGDVLCAPNDEVSWLDSVTRGEVFAIAEQMGLSTRVERVKPADLVESEVWMLSSLQAIRPVVDWLNLGGPVARPTRVEAFERRLRMMAEPIR